MKDQYTDEDGNDITCRNCDVTAREAYEWIPESDQNDGSWMIGHVWYCSLACYEEATKDEG